MEQLKLFDKLVAENNIWDAHIVGKNLYNRNLANKDIFEKYFNFVVTVSGYPIEIETRKYFVSEAETALLFYSENTDINSEELSCIRKNREQLIVVSNAIKELQNKVLSEQKEKIILDNNLNLSELVILKGKLHGANTQEQFDKILIEVNNIENAINKDLFNDEQKVLYDSLTKEYSQIISTKMTELNKRECIEYNKIAIKDFKHAFDEFKDNEAKYNDSQSQLFALVSKRLFSYDVSKLFNETLIYYNHVYLFIFSKLDDNGKFRLTQISIDTERVNG